MRYEIKALRGSEALTAIAVDAVDAGDASAQAIALGYTVIAINAKRSWHVWRKPRKTKFPLVLFSQELLALLDAGLALVEALETLAEKEQRPELQKTLKQIVASLYEGHPLSHALRQSDADFPPLYVAAVRASEKTGALAEALARYVTYQTQMDGVRQQVVSASIYPLLLAGVGGLVMVFLMLYVVPRFSHIYADIGGDLPLMSRLLMGWGQFISDHGGSLFVGVLLLIVSLLYLFTRPFFKQWLTLALWRLPAIGARLHLYQLARFYRSLGMLLRGGMPVTTALKMVSDLLQLSLHNQLALAAECIREGQCISQSMERNGLTTPVALRMLRVGERTGKMGEMMERIAGFYEEETARWVEHFTKLFEPLLMVFIGLLIGGIVVLMYLPIFELAGSIQ
ncbi:MAG TPA: type II secretion system F family protein [Gallionellaceae bacterium]|nr:type II secretion system F family protein [Gallionellaceae bacterium]